METTVYRMAEAMGRKSPLMSAKGLGILLFFLSNSYHKNGLKKSSK